MSLVTAEKKNRLAGVKSPLDALKKIKTNNLNIISE